MTHSEKHGSVRASEEPIAEAKEEAEESKAHEDGELDSKQKYEKKKIEYLKIP